jgi:type IV secretion system protein TrbG
MKPRYQFLFLALLIARLAGAEPIASPGSLPSPTPSPVWTPPTPERETAVQTDSKLASQQDREPAASAQAAATPSPSTTPADLISTLATRQDQPVTLTVDEAAGVEMSKQWRDRALYYESQSSSDGAVQFVFPQEIPSIVCAVLEVTDVALEPGEAIITVSTGDNLRWSVEAVVSGEGAQSQPHLIIKPFDRGLVTSVIVTTTRRTYHLTLRSTDQQYMHEVSFTYPGEPQKQAPPAPEQKPKVNVALTQEVDAPATPEKKSPAHKTSGPLPTEPSRVHRDPRGGPQYTQDPDTYRISGNPRWRPVNVYNDGKKTYVVMTEEMTRTEAPAMLVLRRNNYLFGYDKVLANYRVQHKTYIVDTVFDRAILVSGRDKVTIARVPGKVHEIKNVEAANAGTGK